MEKDEFNITDFTESEYENLLRLAKTNYIFEGFDTDENAKHVIWRHDVDFSMHRAMRLAQIENDVGVKSTYFLMLRSDFYNVMEQEIQICVKKILSLGHKIGLHFDISYYPKITCAEGLADALNYEAGILAKEYSVNIDSFSFHNTSDLTKSFTDSHYGKFLNVYSKKIQEKYDYCSDSNGYWRFDRLRSVIERDDIMYLQVLTHPAWWTPEPMLPRERVKRALEGRAKKVLNTYDEALNKIGRTNAGKI